MAYFRCGTSGVRDIADIDATLICNAQSSGEVSNDGGRGVVSANIPGKGQYVVVISCAWVVIGAQDYVYSALYNKGAATVTCNCGTLVPAIDGAVWLLNATSAGEITAKATGGNKSSATGMRIARINWR